MNKTKIILAAVGGTFGLMALVAGWFVWSAVSARDAALNGDEEEGTDGLETILAKATSLSRKSVFPCNESLKAIDGNKAQFEAWKEEAFKLAARGDKVYPKTTAPAFKEFLIAEAKRLATLPGGVNGVLMKPEFAFGPFKDYITGNAMPKEGELSKLQRQWDDFAMLVEALSKAGIVEVTDLQFKAPAAPAANAERKSAPKAKKQAKTPVRDEKKAKEPSRETYVIVFNTRAAGLVRAINALAVSERFFVVDELGLRRVKDTLAEALGGEERKEAEAQASTRRGRRRRAAQEEEKAEEKEAASRFVADPSLDEPLNVTLTVSVYDFGSLEEERQ